MYVCKDKCKLDSKDLKVFKKAWWYAKGRKLCTVCDKAFADVGKWCPCCGAQLRGNPGTKKFKRPKRIK